MNALQTHVSEANLRRLQAALQTYQAPEAVETTTQPGLFADILTPLSRKKAGSNWRAVNYLWDTYQRGLTHARQGKLSSAEQVFTEARTARAPFVANSLLNQLIDVAALPAVAYLYYKQERYAEAEELLINSLDNDVELLTEGIYILEYHRVQQLHNLARLYFRQGHLYEGARLIAMALTYMLYRQVPAIGNGKGWADEQTNAIPHNLRSDMLWQLTSETVGLFLLHPTELIPLSKVAFGNMVYWDAQTPDEARMLAWFTLIEPGHSNYWPINLSGLITFMITSPPSVDPLKMALILQIVAACEDGPLAALGLQESLRYFIRQLRLGQSQRESCSLFIDQILIRSL